MRIELVVFGVIAAFVIIMSLVIKVPVRETFFSNLPNYGKAPEIRGIDAWINSEPLKLEELKGNVVLVDFWTYTCINCIRTLPYLNMWHEKYSDKGLVIIGVHTPEFEFEKDYNNVVKAVEKYGTKYAVAMDNDYETWNAFNNKYWPRKYLIDINGNIRYDHIGEGSYDETERVIQELLKEMTAVFDMEKNVSEEIAKPAEAEDVDFSKIRSPETYFGAARNSNLANGDSYSAGLQTLTEPDTVERNRLYLVGDWYFYSEFAENQDSGAKIIFKYNAKSVFIVASAEKSVIASVLRDGSFLITEAGEDVVVKNSSSTVNIGEERLYRLVEDDSYGEHILEIIIQEPGLSVFAFTFG